jgi:hypothetical protein
MKKLITRRLDRTGCNLKYEKLIRHIGITGY